MIYVVFMKGKQHSSNLLTT